VKLDSIRFCPYNIDNYFWIFIGICLPTTNKVILLTTAPILVKFVKYSVWAENNLAVNLFARAPNYNLLDFNHKPTLKTYVAEAPTAIMFLVVVHELKYLHLEQFLRIVC
jgi:hypothetical protein